MKGRIIFLCICFFVLQTALQAQNFQTVPYTKGTPVTNNTVIYALPQTALEFELEIRKTETIAGPYASSAKVLLNLDVPQENSSEWKINKAEIRVHYLIDPSHYYLISFKDFPSNVERLLSMTRDGNILDMSLPGFLSSGEFAPAETTRGFRNLNIDGALTARYDTIYKILMTDTSVVRRPSIVKTISLLSQSEQAQAVAQALTEIRQRRFDLSVDGSDYPDGASLRIATETLDRQEKELLSLFTGEQHETLMTRRFALTPDKNQLQVPICYFSEKEGVTFRPAAPEVFCEIKVLENNQPVIGLEVPRKSTNKNIVFYRIPAQAEIRLVYKNEVLATRQVPMYQLGDLMSIPLLAK